MSAANFQPLTVPIDGTHLIEASAGTGKTWNIAALYTRLVAQEKLAVDKILVVTFTKAATAELKTRLRARLDEALAALVQAEEMMQNGADDFADALAQACGKDQDFLLPLLHNALASEDDDPLRARQRLQLRLKAAVSDFDSAAVYTIHGFCQRVLQDFAFFCQLPFAVKLDEEGNPFERLTDAQDFWRQQVAANPLLAPLAFAENLSPQQQLGELMPFVARPYLAVRDAQSADLAALYRELAAQWQQVEPLLAEAETAFWQIFPNLSGTYFKEQGYRQRFATLHGFSGSLKIDAAALLQAIQHVPSKGEPYYPFAAEHLCTKIKKGGTAPTAEQLAAIDIFGRLYTLAQQVLQQEEQAVLAMQQHLLVYLRQAHEQRKKNGPQRQFDDLLLDVFNALQDNAPHAQALAAAMAANWQVALIDEFQDTDPLQYEVFRRAFAQQQGSKALFLVGDPKQAIYSFRGADIFAYLQAADDAAQRHSLAQNHRSHAKLINSINALFQRDLPFVLDKITYPQVSASRRHSRLRPERAALTVRWLNESGSETAAELEHRAAAWCADEIAALLNGAAQGSEQLCDDGGNVFRLPAKGIAVLVRKHQEGAMMQRALAQRGVQSVLLSRDSVFGSGEAQSLLALLQFILQPRRAAPLVFALSGSLYRHSADQLAALNSDDNAMSAWRNLAADALDTWQRFGVYAALQQFLQHHDVEAALLSRREWRTLTNLHQLLELLALEDERQRHPEALAQWLGREIAAVREGENRSGSELRLESDEHLVKIVTMHAAKGLQYPIVFCPFVWRNSAPARKQNWFTVHRDSGKTELLHRSQLDADDQEAVAAANLSEDLRLLYVAFTRAEEQLNLYAGSLKKAQGSNPMAYLLNAQDSGKDADAHRTAWQQFIDSLKNDTDFEWREGAPPAAVFQGSGENRPQFQAAAYRKRTFNRQTHTSFTGLLRQGQTAAAADENSDTLLPAIDAAEPLFRQPENMADDAATSAPPPSGLFAFPQGIAAGVCLHEVMEHLDFRQAIAPQREKVAAVLQKHSFDAEVWTDTVCEAAETVRTVPLTAQIRFADLPEHGRISEMGFLFRADDFKLADIQKWFAQPHLRQPENIVQAAQSLHFRDIDGFVSGFIDETVYTEQKEVLLVDYKSNYLGAAQSDYCQTALDEAMAEHHYYLQALIYAVAAVRYLHSRGRQPETVCVRYLFLRGLDGTQNGIWAWDIAVADLQPWL